MTLIYFILILGITIMIHEFGHFIFAKKAGVYVYEFSIGMGPQIFKFKRKNDETIYSIRLLPIGGFVSMAGEDMEDKTIPADKQLINKTWIQKFLTLIAGVTFNFLLAIILLFVLGLLNGVPTSKPVIGSIIEGYPLENTNAKVGDVITKINGKKVNDTDMLSLLLQINNNSKVNIELMHDNGKTETIEVTPKLEDNTYMYGFKLDTKIKRGIIESIKYSFSKTGSLINQMVHIIGYLCTGKLKLNSLSGPVGIYQVVGVAQKAGLNSVLYLIAYLCINVGFINLIPLPAFDGGRIFFLILSKILGHEVNQKIENTIHTVGFIALLILMVIVTYNDIIRIFT